MSERVFYSEELDEIRVYRFSRIDWIIVKDCGGVVDRGVHWEWIGNL